MADMMTKIGASFRPQDLRGAAFIGLLVGLGTFWNGSLMIAALLILGSAIVWAPRRGELLIACVLATVLALVEARLFITTGKGVSPYFHFGFIAEPQTVRGVVRYFIRLLGVLVPILMIALVLLRSRGRWFLASLLVPVAFACLFAFTPDLTVNHKFVNAGVRIASLFAALVVILLLDRGRLGKTAAIILTFALTVTGAVDLISLWNYNTAKNTHNLADPLIEWAVRNTPPDAVFASAPIYHNRAYLTGRKAFLGLPYWAESAGYDVPPRLAALKVIYESGNPEQIRATVRAEGISYVIVDDSVRTNFPAIDERAVAEALPLVFRSEVTRVYGVASKRP